MTTPTVREVSSEDEAETAEIGRLAMVALRKVYQPTSHAISRRAAVSVDLRRLVAVLDGRVVGVVDYYFTENRLSFLGLGVHPQFQRRGVATALIRELERIGRGRGCAAVLLHTVRETGNVAIFERLGFSVESEDLTDLFELEGGMAAVEVVMRKNLVQEE